MKWKFFLFNVILTSLVKGGEKSMRYTVWFLFFLVWGRLFSSPFPGMEVDQDTPMYVETKEYAPIKEKTHFREVKWGEERASIIQKETATFFTNVVQDSFLIMLFRESGKKWLSFLQQEIFIGYVFEKNKLLLGYYLIPFQRFEDATNTYEKVKKHFVQQYSPIGSYSLGLIHPPHGDLEGVLAFYRWRTSNTVIELTLERDKIVLFPQTRQSASVPFVIVMSYTDVKQEERSQRALDDHP